MKKYPYVLYTFLFLLLSYPYAWAKITPNLLTYVDTTEMNLWVEQTMSHLTPDQRLGQLLMPLYIMTEDTPDNRAKLASEMEQYHYGGILWSRGTRASQRALTQYSQQLSQTHTGTPLLISADAEWGLAMRLKDAVRFPRNASLAQIHPALRDSMLYLYGLAMARECRDMGIHMDFGPVMDVNSNPRNPVIGTRSFGDNTELVTRLGLCFSAGLEDGGVMAVAKHFPGHGDTDKDSHKTLPVLKHKRKTLLNREFKPFEAFVKKGFGGVMAAHLDVEAFDKGKPSVASHVLITEQLRERMGFDGLVVTDGLAMQGAIKYRGPKGDSHVCVEALLAGCDILLQPTPIATAWKALTDARDKGKIPQTLIDDHCRRVLKWKYALTHQNNVIDCPVRPEVLAAELTRLTQNTSDTKLAIDLYDPTLRNATEPEIPAEEPIAFHVPTYAMSERLPEDVGMDSRTLNGIDAIAQEAVKNGATPGCQVLVAKDGKIVYNKAFGTMGAGPTANTNVTTMTYYDLASVSKIAATVPAMILAMKEYDIKLKDHVTKWIPEFKGTKYKDVTVSDLLYHESGLPLSYPIERYCSYDSLMSHPELQRQVRDSVMINAIAQAKSKVRRGQYRYSCINFVVLRYIIERVSHQRLDVYLNAHLAPYFGRDLCFNPLEQGIDIRQIAPTELDNQNGRGQLQGTVHDEIAAWAMGIEGNAGLFAPSATLARLMQLILDNGEWDGKQYLDASLCRQFTTQRSKNSRRGLGFDRQTAKGAPNPNLAPECSPQTWGHTGFTGTCVWVDPKHQLIYIFLSNRVCPTRENPKLSRGNYRTRIHSLIYQSLKKGK